MTFEYHSEQTHTAINNGTKTTKKNTVTVKNGKGTKTVTVKENGRTRKSMKPLTPKEIRSIQKSQFIPGLFRKQSRLMTRRRR